MNKINKSIFVFCLMMLCLLFAACGEQANNDNKEEPKQDEKKEEIVFPYGNDLGLVINDGRTFVSNVDVYAGTNYKWTYTISLDGVINKIEEKTIIDEALPGAKGKLITQFEADIDLNKTKRIVVSFVYNTPDMSEKHPKTYDYKLAVTYDGEITIEEIVERNVNGVDESEHVWIHYEGQKMTCKQDGWTEYDECSICGERRGYEFFTSCGGEHDYQLSSSSDTPSKEMPAHSELTCTKCGDKTGDYVNPLNRGEEGMNNLNILLIGNSYTNYNTMMNAFKGIIEGEGISVNIVKVSYGSQYLYDYIEGPKGDYYKEVEKAVNKTKFDIVFLQEQSTNAVTSPANFYDSVRDLYAYFTKLGSTCILYETWTRKGGYSGWSENEMTQRMVASYSAIANELGLWVSHCGTAVYYLMNRLPNLPSHNSDNSHPSTYTSYLVALCHYATLYGRSPIGINYTYNDYINDASITWHSGNAREEITDEVQTQLEQIVYDAVFGSGVLTSKYATSSIGVTEKK